MMWQQSNTIFCAPFGNCLVTEWMYGFTPRRRPDVGVTHGNAGSSYSY